MTQSVPIVHIQDLHSPASLAAIDRACREWGFFQVTGHGIPARQITEIFTVSRAFFAQSVEQKRSLLRDAENPWGYYDRELTKNRRDWKEIYDYGPAYGGRIAPRWPHGPLGARFQAAVLAYYQGCHALALRLLGAIAANLGADADELLGGFRADHTSFLRLNFYPSANAPADQVDSGLLGVGEHTDSGALTLLLQDRQPGLEVQRGSRWYPVHPIPGALVINIGDIVQVWSNDRYQAAVHRVTTHPARDRYSVPFFLNPAYDVNYAPLPGTGPAQQPARYRQINWREFRRLRAAGDYANLGDEIQISHYRY